MTKQAIRYPGLDLLRAMAILMVLFLHSTFLNVHESHSISSTVSDFFSYGWIGVDLFFVLSGYLIGQQIFSTSENTPLKTRFYEFWLKRWSRTVPLYAVVFFFYLFIKPLVGWKFNSNPLPFFFFVQNFFPLTDYIQTWSLCIEEQFYFAFPIIFFLLFKRNRYRFFWFSLAFMSVLLRYQVMSRLHFEITDTRVLDALIRYNTPFHLDGIALGVFLASTESDWKIFAMTHAKKLFTLGWVGFLATAFYCGSDLQGYAVIYYYFFIALSFSLMLMGAKFIPLKGIFSRICYRVSLYSYGLYLWNNLFERLIEKMAHSLPWALNIALFFTSSFFIAFLTYHWVEKPGIEWRNRRLLS